MAEAELLKLLEYEQRLEEIFSSCFTRQLEAIKDTSKRKVIRCSRRAGKTELACLSLIHRSLESPDGISVYIALTRKSAKRLIWGRLKKLLKGLDMPFNASETELIISFPNGSEIWLAGANQEDVAETLRGNAYRLVCLDECASFRGHIDTLIEEILEPATLDEDGELWIMGTPSWDFSSYFYRANHNKEEWTSFHWTLFDNPHLKNTQQWVADLKRRRGWSDDNPILLREYFGKWVKSFEEMVYLFNPLRNIWETLPHLDHFVLGVDMGFQDKTAFSIVAHAEDSPVAYVVHSEKHGHMLPNDIARRIKELMESYDLHTIVVDEGGLGRSIAEEFRIRHQIPCKAAKKTEKRSYIELFNSELKEGRILVAEDNPVIEEWNSLLWDDSKKIEKPGLPNDVADATLYAWRESFYFLEVEPDPAPQPGSKKALEAEEKRMIEDRINKYTQESDTPAWW